jgi:hypothetical protein
MSARFESPMKKRRTRRDVEKKVGGDATDEI